MQWLLVSAGAAELSHAARTAALRSLGDCCHQRRMLRGSRGCGRHTSDSPAQGDCLEVPNDGLAVRLSTAQLQLHPSLGTNRVRKLVSQKQSSGAGCSAR